MSLSRALVVVQVLTKHSLQMIPITVDPNTSYFVACKGRLSVRCFWIVLQAISLANSILQCYFHKNANQIVQVLQLLFHGFHVVTKSAVLSFDLMYSFKTMELCSLLNYILYFIQNQTNKSSCKLCTYIVFACPLSMICVCYIILPCVSLLSPCSYKFSSVNIPGVQCSSPVFTAALVLTELVCLTPHVVIGSLVTSTVLIILIDVHHRFICVL